MIKKLVFSSPKRPALNIFEAKSFHVSVVLSPFSKINVTISTIESQNNICMLESEFIGFRIEIDCQRKG